MFQLKDTTMLAPDELAVCQRVFNQVCAARQISLDIHREEVAKQIFDAYRNGIKDENSLIRLLL